uniref:Uncharacterized protein n=1 Tax=Zooxanthella nutricula TaxID=1333877 RepID=A0A7S2LEE3_9DINO
MQTAHNLVLHGGALDAHHHAAHFPAAFEAELSHLHHSMPGFVYTTPQKARHDFDESTLSTAASTTGPPAADDVVPKAQYNQLKANFDQLLALYHDSCLALANMHERHGEVMCHWAKHMTHHAEIIHYAAEAENQLGAGGMKRTVAKKTKRKAPILGVMRLDYNYPPAVGDTDSPASFGYDVMYRVVPGLTFEIAQAGTFEEKVERYFAEAIKWLENKGANAITGDCGFMMAFQILARKIATRPVFMSSMVQCPIIACAFDPNEKIMIMTANSMSLKPQKDVLLSSCGFDVNEERFIIVGCQNVKYFDAVARGEAVPMEKVQPGVVALAQETIRRQPMIRGILLECTELPAYADALRAKTGLPVWDAITGADFYINAYKDNPRFGINDWQAEWDETVDEYEFASNLAKSEASDVVSGFKKKQQAKAAAAKSLKKKIEKQCKKNSAPCLGVVRLDYNYPPAAGDIDCPGSYDYDVKYRCVPGLTFAMAQSGKMTPKVQEEFMNACRDLEKRGCCGITGDCGFMMAFQPLARTAVNIPVFMSSMVQCPMVSVAFDKYDRILILTANGETLKPQKDILLNQCGFDVDDTRFIIKGCQNIPGFDAVAKGEQVDVEFVTPGMIEMVKGILSDDPSIRAIVLECTELPPYADALRAQFSLPVWDAITCADFFISSRKDNPRFGLNQWQADWDGIQDEYTLGQNLSQEAQSRLLNA